MITIFTPTYNRAYILPQLYKSLQQQQDKSFEWLIVDDGSPDHTEELVKRWQQQTNGFPIIYSKQPNGGKHRAINKGLAQARGEWFFIVDSDDWLPADAIRKIVQHIQSLPSDGRFAGICGFRANKEGRPFCNSATIISVIDCSMIEIRQKYHIKGDMAEVFKTDILRQFPFPEFEGENFVNEAVVWNQIAEKYILRYVPEVLYFCEYQPDGLTRSIRQKYRANPQGTICLYKAIFASRSFNKRSKIRFAILYWRYLCFYKAAYKQAPKWTFLFYPLGIMLCLYDYIRRIL